MAYVDINILTKCARSFTKPEVCLLVNNDVIFKPTFAEWYMEEVVQFLVHYGLSPLISYL